MSYPFVHAQRPQFPLRVLCRTVGVTESGYHSWRQGGRNEQKMMRSSWHTSRPCTTTAKDGTAPPGCTGTAGNRCVLFAPPRGATDAGGRSPGSRKAAFQKHD